MYFELFFQVFKGLLCEVPRFSVQNASCDMHNFCLIGFIRTFRTVCGLGLGVYDPLCLLPQGRDRPGRLAN